MSESDVDHEQDDFRAIVVAASSRPEAVRAVHEVYADLQLAIDDRKPACAMSGRCCRFEEYGHRLFVTSLEIAAFLADMESPEAAPGAGRLDVRGAMRLWDGAGCPFQIQKKLCGVHPHRPFGCRIFFCDASATAWQNEQYERFHSRLKAMHQKLLVPYRYVEWRWALRAIFSV